MPAAPAGMPRPAQGRDPEPVRVPVDFVPLLAFQPALPVSRQALPSLLIWRANPQFSGSGNNLSLTMFAQKDFICGGYRYHPWREAQL